MSINVRGSVTTPPPHLIIQTNKRVVVPLLSWLPCSQACRQVVRHKLTPRRFEIHSRSLSDVELTATQKKRSFKSSLLLKWQTEQEKWLWHIIVLLGNCLFWHDHKLTVFHEMVIFGRGDKSSLCRGRVVAFLWSQEHNKQREGVRRGLKGGEKASFKVSVLLSRLVRLSWWNQRFKGLWMSFVEFKRHCWR